MVILGAGLDTRPTGSPGTRLPVFEVDQQVNIDRKAAVCDGCSVRCPLSVQLVAVDFERDDLMSVLAEHGYRAEDRTLFVWEGVTQYLTEAGVRRTFEQLRAAAPGSRLIFTYVRQDFIDGTNLYGARTLYRNSRSATSCGSSASSPTRSPGSSPSTAGGWSSRPVPTTSGSLRRGPPAATSASRSNGRRTRRKLDHL